MTSSGDVCVAFVKQSQEQDDGGKDEVIVYDAKGEARTFSPSKATASGRKVCYSSHNKEEDEMMTPCFDEDGHHGDPEETCFCGVDSPHLHAHYYDATTCDDEVAGGGCGSKKKKKTEDPMLKLVTLFPSTQKTSSSLSNGSSGENGEETEATPLLVGANGNSGFGSTAGGRRTSQTGRLSLHKVMHGDQEGHVAMDEETGDLYWEHGDDESNHKKLTTVAKRKLGGGVSLHFVQDLPHKATSSVSAVINYLGSHFEPDHGAVAAIKHTSPVQHGRKHAHDHSHGHGHGHDKEDGHGHSHSHGHGHGHDHAAVASTAKPKEHDHSHSHGHGHSHNHSEAAPKKKSCCSGGTCSAKKAATAAKEAHNKHDHGHSHGHGHNHDHNQSAEGGGKKKSCCSGGTCSKKKQQASSSHDHGHSHGHGHSHDHSAPKKKSCCSGGTCSKKKAADSHDHGHSHGHGHSHNHSGGAEPKKKSCCSGGTCSSKKKAESPPKKKSCCSGGKCSASAPPPPTRPPCCDEFGNCSMSKISDCCATGKCTASFMPMDLLEPEPTDDKVVRSTIECKEICCSAEIPAVNKVMDSLDGISKSMVNVPFRLVTVDHNPSIITALDIEKALNEAYLGAVIKRDGGASASGTSGRSQFHVQKICCAAEIPQINQILQPMEGVSNVAVNVTTKMVYVDHDTAKASAQSLADALNDALMGATIKKDAGATIKGAVAAFVRSTLKIVEPEEPDEDVITKSLNAYKPTELESFVVDAAGNAITLNHSPLLLPLQSVVDQLRKDSGVKTTILNNGADDIEWDFPLYEEVTKDQEIDSGEEDKWPKPTVILSGIFWIVSMFSFIGGPMEYVKYIALLAVAFGIPSIARKAFSTMKRFMFDSNCLMFFAAIGALLFQEYTEAAAVTFLFALSEWLESRATTRGRNALSAIVNLRPDFAWIVHPKTKEQLMIPASAVPVGAVVAVKTGDKIPCDGVVIEGHSTVDESSLTGESRPVKKIPKSIVSGGTVNCGQNHLMIQTTSTAENSAISRLVCLVEEAQANRSETEKIVDEFAKVYTPVVVLASLCMCTIPWFFGPEVGRLWTYNGLVLMVVACPCALIISTPVTYVAGLAATAQRGVLIKGGAHLESLGLVKTICFDKTGTLTQGSFALIAINPIGTKYTRKQILEYLVLMEERANHPLAMAIVDGAKNEGVMAPQGKKVNEHTFMAGEGLSGKIDGVQIYVGSSRLFNRLGLLDDIDEELDNTIWNWEAMAGTVGFMSVDGELVCAYCVADAVRNESIEVVAALDEMGIDVHMLTGDNKVAANAIGNLVGLKPEGINSELLPEEKLKFITDLKGGQIGRTVLSNPMGKRELVCHVGDGVNDAPALAAADLGVAMGVGAALAMETADITLLDSNLKKLQFSVDMGRRVLWTIKENVVFSLVVKVVVLGFTLMGKVALWAAIVSDVGAMLCVTLNGMKLLPSRKIDAELMGDVANSSYHSQVTKATTGHSHGSHGGGGGGGLDLENMMIKV